jgi:hypothetical protein
VAPVFRGRRFFWQKFQPEHLPYSIYEAQQQKLKTAQTSCGWFVWSGFSWVIWGIDLRLGEWLR